MTHAGFSRHCWHFLGFANGITQVQPSIAEIKNLNSICLEGKHPHKDHNVALPSNVLLKRFGVRNRNPYAKAGADLNERIVF